MALASVGSMPYLMATMALLPTEPLQIVEPLPRAAATTCAATWSACRATS